MLRFHCTICTKLGHGLRRLRGFLVCIIPDKFYMKKLSTSAVFTLIQGIILCCLVCGIIWPETWWGTHFLIFSPNIFKIGIALFAVFTLIYAWNQAGEKMINIGFPSLRGSQYWLPVGIGILVWCICYLLPLASTFYGNGRALEPLLDQHISSLPQDFWTQLLRYDFSAGNDRTGVVLLVKWVSYVTGGTMYEAFKLWDAANGALFAGLWVYVVRREVQAASWQIILIALGLSSSVMLVFMGHVELYAFVYMLLLVWLIVWQDYVQQGGIVRLVLLVVLLLIGVRFHALMVLLTPMLGLTIAYRYAAATVLMERLASMKGMLLYGFLPLLAIGLAGYFFVFEDHYDSRQFENFEDIDRLFLPLFSPKPPLDRYNLLSLNHLLDYLNILIFWSPALWVVIGFFLSKKRSQINWDEPEVVFSVLGMLTFMAMLFAINPLFSMPMDWDLFLFPVPIFLIVLLNLTKQIQPDRLSQHLAFSVGSFMMWCIPVFVVFLSKPATANRIEATGKHIFKTYHYHASTYLLYSLHMQDGLSVDEYLTKKQSILQDLLPYATPDNDKQYADLLVDQALTLRSTGGDSMAVRQLFLQSTDYFPLKGDWLNILKAYNVNLEASRRIPTRQDSSRAFDLNAVAFTLVNEKKDPKAALKVLDRAQLYHPSHGEIIVNRMTAHFILEDYAASFVEAQRLVDMQYPTQVRALRMGTHLALEAGEYEYAARYVRDFLKLEPKNELFQTLQSRLTSKEQLEELKFLFKRK